ncbi:NAD(P)/FAD-dependent oxidoreductase [Sphingomonas nostoxanthinifaciens]|uniref:NAD(P)/FAD-dependent oxidoreductase n=1 Tax=Sphingomonas nostoxanthinifaciens TaxID=2872652 RepID=UPI001CC1D486|nr:FAD-binding oxidoreductase [Sphingomonas nostoxanthinifaciens]UAK22913.1 FAD-binding oxidoreductase [Sphingomonas nostoxanthinifaciens]
MSIRVDVLVIGAGLVGAATAWHCARAGATVLVADAAHANAGASGQNAGSLHFQIERRFLENGERLAEDASRITALSRLAIDDWDGLEMALDADLHVRREGGLMVAELPEELALLETKVVREQEAGLRTRLIDGDEARRIAPYLSPDIIAAAFLPDEGHADPRAVTPAFLRAARMLGAEVAYDAPVQAIRKRQRFEVELSGETVIADRIMIAAGAWSPRIAALANLHLPLFPVGLTMNATERVAPIVPHLVQHVGRRLSLKQTHAGNILIGGGWPSRLRLGADGAFDPGLRPDPLPASRDGNFRAAIATVPAIADMNLLRSWTGVTAISADQLPIVGEMQRMPGLFVAAGGSAFTLGPTFARLAARQMLEWDRAEADEELAIIAPARFEHLNGFMG